MGSSSISRETGLALPFQNGNQLFFDRFPIPDEIRISG
jgi:hypothetical protein